MEREFHGLQIIESTGPDLTAFSAGRRRRYSFAVCLQVQGGGAVAHNDMHAAIAEGEIFIVAPLSNVVWQSRSVKSRCIIVSGGAALSLRFRPRPVTDVKLGSRHPIVPLLRNCVEQLIGQSADRATTRKKLEAVFADMVEIALDGACGHLSDQTFFDSLARAEDQLDNPQFDVSALAGEIGVTLQSLHGRFKSLNTTPNRWITERRLERARKKLADSSFANLSIRQIARSTGFEDFVHFERAFRYLFGTLPKRYRY